MNSPEVSKLSETESSDLDSETVDLEKNSKVPPFSDFYRFVLDTGAEGEVHIRKAAERAGDYFNLSSEARNQLVPSKTETTVYNRTSWAVSYLVQAGLLERPKRGFFAISELGRKILNDKPERIDIKFLRRFEGFRDFENRKRNITTIIESEEDLSITEDTTPEERIEEAYDEIFADLKTDLLNRILNENYTLFEKLVLQLLIAMGYGDFRKDASEHTGGGRDGGVDGIINQDKLGMEKICIQAKLYTEDPVGEPKLRDFAGSIKFRMAQKGVFITTSTFTQAAKDYAEKIPEQLILIDKERLLDLMVEYNVGVEVDRNIELKKIDEDFFERL